MTRKKCGLLFREKKALSDEKSLKKALNDEKINKLL